VKNFLLRSLLPLAFYANTAAASCETMFMPDFAELTKCVKSQQTDIRYLERRIDVMSKVLDVYERSLDNQSKEILRLSDRIFQLRTEIALIKPPQSKPPIK